jgi:hypothetical protein
MTLTHSTPLFVCRLAMNYREDWQRTPPGEVGRITQWERIWRPDGKPHAGLPNPAKPPKGHLTPRHKSHKLDANEDEQKQSFLSYGGSKEQILSGSISYEQFPAISVDRCCITRSCRMWIVRPAASGGSAFQGCLGAAP